MGKLKLLHQKQDEEASISRDGKISTCTKIFIARELRQSIRKVYKGEEKLMKNHFSGVCRLVEHARDIKAPVKFNNALPDKKRPERRKQKASSIMSYFSLLRNMLDPC